ncbi:MAG TPA: tetratricopeptide repeat protein [Burkholderiales bacterium]|jgi:Flp pilus assembly protein TadD|nr:tetratricopeptide repeat protein [Burkholderiales bacterium]
MHRTLALAILLAAFASSPAFAADTPSPPKDPDKKELEATRAAIAQEDWARARELARAALARAPRSADAHNLYAYSLRRGPNPPMDLVFRHYNEALRLNPQHLGAHEYLAEAYLMTGNLAKAREHLAILGRLCGACEEQQKLARSVANAERQQATK